MLVESSSLRLSNCLRLVLLLLADAANGCTESILMAHGFAIGMLRDLVRKGLATAEQRSIRAGRRTIEDDRSGRAEGDSKAVRTRCRTFCSPPNHRCRPRLWGAIAAAAMRPEVLSPAELSCRETWYGKRCSCRRRVRCRSGRPARPLQPTARIQPRRRVVSLAPASNFWIHDEGGTLASRIEYKGRRRIEGSVRIEHVAPVAHIHLGLEVSRLEMIVADLEHLPEG
jgi:hypothetical protein